MNVQRLLIIAGVSLLVAGVAWPWLSRLPIGRLPGDIMIDRPGFRFYFPLMTSLLVSALIGFVMWLLRR